MEQMKRRESLDGLRGVAALAVLVHHAMLTSAVFSQPAENTGWFTYLLTYTPLRVLWEGKGAVYVFFVLSGVVLAVAITGSKSFSWISYYPQRLLRLYVPVWAALALGIAAILLVPRSSDVASTWLADRDLPVTADRVIQGITLVGGHGGLVSPMWSLRWEVLFSLLLPVFAWVGIRLVRWRWAVATATLLLVGVGVAAGNSWLTYLPIFLLGVLIAVSIDELDALSARMKPGVAVALTIAAPILLVAPWLLGPSLQPGTLGTAFLEMASVLGATLTVVVALAVPAVRTAFSSRSLRWFGMISFSLYLIHEPVLVAFAVVFGDGALLPAALLSIPASIALAWVFYRIVEVPSHRLARWCGASVRGARGSSTRGSSAPHRTATRPIPVESTR